MNTPKMLAMVMAGGEGKRLFPLTAERSKPAVPFAGRYRIVDFVLSNLINSGIHSIYLLVQYKSQSLIEHVRKAWAHSPPNLQHFVTVVPPQMRGGPEWFQGTADAVYQNRNLILTHYPDLVAVFGADHIYRMDVTQMVRFHMERDADVTIAALPVALKEAQRFGVLVTDAAGRVRSFQEKPARPEPMPDDPEHCYASMGNYLFRTQTLIDALAQGHERGERDFGRDVLPRLTDSRAVLAYDFTSAQVPGTKPYEEPAYWRDVGSIDSYFEAHQDVLGLNPCFDLFNTAWPIYSDNYQGPVTKMMSGNIENSMVGAGSTINQAHVRNSVLRREVCVDDDVEIDECLIMDYCKIGKGARLRRTIIDRYNEIPPGTEIGYDAVADRERYYVTESGLIVLPKGTRGLEPVY